LEVIGLGTDIVEISRVERLWAQYGERFLKRVFDYEEVKYALKKKKTCVHLASAFSVKESFFKATGGYYPFIWKEVILKRDHRGKPYVKLKGRAQEKFFEIGAKKIFVSISHEKNHVISVVLLTG